MLTSKCPGEPNATDRTGRDLDDLQRVASGSFQSAIYTSPIGECASMLGLINLQLMEELGCSKRLTGDCTIS